MGSTKASDGSIYIDPRDVSAFIFTKHSVDKRAAQLLVYLRNGHIISFLGDRANLIHKMLLDRYPYESSYFPDPNKLPPTPKK